MIAVWTDSMIVLESRCLLHGTTGCHGRVVRHIETVGALVVRGTLRALNCVSDFPPELFANFDEGGVFLAGINGLPNPG